MTKGTKAHAVIVGRMGADATMRTTSAGRKIANFRLACVDGYGEHEQTSWFDVVVFDEKKAEVVEKYTGKGSRVMAIGTLRVRKWQDQSGGDRYTTELVVNFDGSIELMDSKDEAQHKGTVRDRAPDKPQPTSAFDPNLDDDVPF